MKFTISTIVLLVPVFVWVIVRWVFDFNGLYGQDAHAYAQFSQEIFQFIGGGEAPGAFFWPVNYSAAGAMLSFVVRDPIVALQMISMGAFVGVVWYVRKFVRFLFNGSDSQLDWFLLLFLALSPFMLRAGMVAMSDMMAAFLGVAAVYHLIRYTDSLSRKDFFLGAIFAGLAFMTRYAAVFILIIPVACAVWSAIKKRDFLVLIGGIVVSAVGFIPHWLYHKAAAFDFIQHEALTSWSLKNFFKLSFETSDGIATYNFPNLAYSFGYLYHPGFIFLGVILLFFCSKHYLFRKRSKIIFFSLLLYSLFLAGVNYQNQRFLILAFPLAILLFYPAWQKVSGFMKISYRKYAIVGIGLLQIALFTYTNRTHYQTNQLEKEAVTLLRNRPETTVYTFWLDGAMKTYGVPQNVVNLWTKDLQNFKKGSLVLFNEPMFAKQWQGKNPMNNWNRIKQKHSLETVADLRNGWHLYRIE